MEKRGFIYILASRINGTLYIGVTSNLPRRIYEHRQGLVPGFTRKFGVKRLVYYELHDSVSDVIGREKRLKKFGRSDKIRLIESINPDWDDLWDVIYSE